MSVFQNKAINKNNKNNIILFYMLIRVICYPLANEVRGEI